MKRIIVVLFILQFNFGLFAQNNNVIIDSLLNQLSIQKADIEKEKIYRNLCERYLYTNPDSSIYFGLKSIELCNKNGSLKNIEYVYYILGETYLDVSLEKSKSYFFKAIEESKITRNDSVENLAYFGLSSYYSNFSNVDSSLYYNRKSKLYFESKNDTNALINCYQNMMAIYSMVYNYDKTIEYGLKCEKLFRKNEQHYLEGEVYISLSYAYDNIKGDKNIEKSQLYIDKAEKIALNNDISYLLLSIYTVKGVRLHSSEDFENAIFFFKKALKQATNQKDLFNISLSHYNLGISYFKIGNNIKAAYHYKKINDLESGPLQKRSYLHLALIYSNVAKTQSLMYLSKHDSLDELLKLEKDRELLIEYETLEKEKENLALTIENKNKELQNQTYKIQAQKNKFYLVLGIITFIILALFSTLFYRFKRRQSKNKIVNLQKQALQLQLNPHFFFNALNSINAYVGKQETDKAKYYLGKFSKLMRLTLENSQLDYVSLEDELSFLENYMTLEQMNSDNFEFEINIDEDLLDIKIPSMLLQPFVENSIEHAFNKLIDEKGKIIIKITETIGFINVVIADNGIGISKQNNNNEHKSVAIELLKKRIDLYSKGKSKIIYTVPFPDKINKGAQVTFSVPINE